MPPRNRFHRHNGVNTNHDTPSRNTRGHHRKQRSSGSP
ncbi:hypothetical protein FHS43_001222 [Streptosporangium becharense]|uniref:Uncharacterized protein n=1 Tax=Streptosporangium becharense TaxID=1816182 RepID=A0A7W9IFB2_9ACTN|nr:hypothetical protein [Streptosporangium becharense]MBB5819069.1 hypothetical protein [Streptosporangium becharense]